FPSVRAAAGEQGGCGAPRLRPYHLDQRDNQGPHTRRRRAGARPRIAAVVMHSGETLAAPMAELASEERPLAGRRILIIVENLPLPFDRRVWQEARTLRAAGATVSIICPTGKGYEARYEELEGVHIYRHPLPLDAGSALGYVLEY